MSAQILIADDDAVSCQLFAKILEREGYWVEWCESGNEALERLRETPCDLLLIDVQMPGMTGLEVTRISRTEQPELSVVVMTGFGSIETAIEAIQEGAFDYLSKPMDLEALKQTVSKALAQRALLTRQHPSGEQQTDQKDDMRLGTVIGKSPAMVEVYKDIARVAPTKSTVLILGESGTGKEMIARALHQHSPWATRPFVAVDCGALTESLLETELFGHVRGAFTGATADKKGIFEEAQGGTCFLDEIGDISPPLQAKLLRVLQEHEVRRVGGTGWIRVDIRVIAATNKDLADLVNKGLFRNDLYYRLKVIALTLPPLRDRLEEIPVLAEVFLQRYSQANGKAVSAMSDEALDLLQAYAWPGNIRELEHTIEQAVALARQAVLVPEDLPIEVREGVSANVSAESPAEEAAFFAASPTLEEVNKRYIEHILSQTQGNVSRAAKLLDIDRRSLYRMLERYQIAPFAKDASD